MKKLLGRIFDTDDLGIENVRLRGIARMLIGVVLTAIGCFVGIVVSIIGLVVTDILPRSSDGGSDIFVLFFVGFAIPIFTSVYVIWGIVEFIFNVAWDNLDSKIRLVFVLILGIPLMGAITFLVIDFAGQLESWIEGIF